MFQVVLLGFSVVGMEPLTALIRDVMRVGIPLILVPGTLVP